MEMNINFRCYSLKEIIWILPDFELSIETKELFISWLCFEIAIEIK